MKPCRVSILGLVILLATGLGHGSDRVVIVLDTSTGMWDAFQSGPPRIVAARTAITSILAAPSVAGRKMEFGLRTVGGQPELTGGPGCDDSDVIIDPGPVDPLRWAAILADLTPGGLRPLAHAIREAAHDLGDGDADLRIVVITSGADQCWGDIATVVKELAQGDHPIPVRFVGLEIEHAVANSFVLAAPTRNVTDHSTLLESLGWAVFPAGLEPGRPEWLELRVSRGQEAMDGASVILSRPFGGDEVATSIENGHARVRATQGTYRAKIDGAASAPIELSEIVHHGRDEVIDIALSDAPPVTLEVDSEHLLAGEDAFIQFWGAPPGTNWVEICVSGAPAHQFLVRTPATGAAGEVALMLPDAPNTLEVQFTQDIGSGIHQVLGRLAFETVRRRVSIEAPERAENRTQLTVAWSGDDLPGDHITISSTGDGVADSERCLPASANGPAALTAPAEPGDYVIRYASRYGRTLARADLEVFEVLATLEGPGEVAPGDPFSVAWTGPDASQDYLSIAAADEGGEQYRTFTPASSGNPARFAAPMTPGEYELRYVRAADGEVLARQPLTVRTQAITLAVPRVVEAGTRFEVEWSGTAATGDFIAIAHPRSGAKKHLDWSFTNLGSPVTLAAPFEPGRYVVRYVRAEDQEIIARESIDVR